MTLSDLITVLVPTSPIPSHPSTAIIDETLDSIDAAGLDACEVVVMCDGVRPEQEDRSADYAEYVRRLSWSLDERPRSWPFLFPEHRHQAAMTREALDKVTTPLVPMALEAFGLAEPGGSHEFFTTGQNRIDGRLPVNTHGGLLSEGYFHGLNSIAEAARQLRGESHNQRKDARVALVTVRGASSLILGRA